ncbi:hypothetical protein SNEBB_008185 [Seison nebaliae]|nr:hypothetical protein SNEBB_008185 [Seison nebaliae]
MFSGLVRSNWPDLSVIQLYANPTINIYAATNRNAIPTPKDSGFVDDEQTSVVNCISGTLRLYKTTTGKLFMEFDPHHEEKKKLTNVDLEDVIERKIKNKSEFASSVMFDGIVSFTWSKTSLRTISYVLEDLSYKKNWLMITFQLADGLQSSSFHFLKRDCRSFIENIGKFYQITENDDFLYTIQKRQSERHQNMTVRQSPYILFGHNFKQTVTNLLTSNRRDGKKFEFGKNKFVMSKSSDHLLGDNDKEEIVHDINRFMKKICYSDLKMKNRNDHVNSNCNPVFIPSNIDSSFTELHNIILPSRPIKVIEEKFQETRSLSKDDWTKRDVKNSYHRIIDQIFHGGVDDDVRPYVWLRLLNVVPWEVDDQSEEFEEIMRKKREHYETICHQWKSMLPEQLEKNSILRERFYLVDKDVLRTDRTLEFYSPPHHHVRKKEPIIRKIEDIDDFENDVNNSAKLTNILKTYCMFNGDIGYVQGMSDIASIILMAVDIGEADAFWCFVGAMNMWYKNFEIQQTHIRDQLNSLRHLLEILVPKLAAHLEKNHSLHMCFCFRWLLVFFKRELTAKDCMRFWEALWTEEPCYNFHLLICCAILDQHAPLLLSNNYDFNQILKSTNELCGRIDMKRMLIVGKAMYLQLKETLMCQDFRGTSTESVNDFTVVEKDGTSTTIISRTDNIDCTKENDGERALYAMLREILHMGL